MRTGRLPASERRAALLDCACRVFSAGSYRGATTAEIANAAGVTEPVLYRHFDSKRDLYLACLADTWAELRVLWDEALEAEPDPAVWLSAMGRAFLASEGDRRVISNMWIQALSEASEDPAIARFMRAHIHEVHDYAAAVVRRGQEAGGIAPERDPDAGAWTFIALGLLSIADRRLDGIMGEGWAKIREARVEWLRGRA
jgi:AcrR family transcriptional regulator